MSRVNLDGKVWKDPRVKRLAKRRSWSVRETIGTLAAVWDVAYDNKTPIMPKIDVDTAAETDKFADDMVAEDLATEVGDKLLDVRLRGVTERIDFLLTQAERGRLGGLAKAAAKRQEGTFVADAKQTPSERQAPAYHSGGLPLDPDPPPPPPPHHDQSHSRDHDLARSARLAGLLHDLIAKNKPTGKIAKHSEEARDEAVNDWSIEISRLHRLDGIAWCDIEAALAFSQSDSFWQTNVLSGKALRKHYDQLDAQRTRKTNGHDVRVGRVEPQTDPTAYGDGDQEL